MSTEWKASRLAPSPQPVPVTLGELLVPGGFFLFGLAMGFLVRRGRRRATSFSPSLGLD